jgi:hypothetical protein
MERHPRFGMLIPLCDVVSAAALTERDHAGQHWFLIAAPVAIWINAYFGVLIEGLVSGIPFCFLLGLLTGTPKLSRSHPATHLDDYPGFATHWRSVLVSAAVMCCQGVS